MDAPLPHSHGPMKQYCFSYTLKTDVLKVTHHVLFSNTSVCLVKDNTFCVNLNTTLIVC